MFPHMMAPSLPRPPGPFDAYAGLDPFRDAYRLDLLARDPLREARDRELMRLNPLGSLVNTELERAKALGLAGYPALPGGHIPGYPTTTSLSMMSKMAPSPYSSLYTSPSMLGLPHGASLGAHGAMGMNGVPGAGSQYNGKDPLRR
jgi:hypothetical protein